MVLLDLGLPDGGADDYLVKPFPFAELLDVHMSNLLRKIGDGFIRTVRGIGYSVDGVASEP
jgi:DNA-binding response OmpR family regulator